MMNHNDRDANFSREIELFDRVILKLRETNNNPLNVSGYSDVKEGGNPEKNKNLFMISKNAKNQDLIK